MPRRELERPRLDMEGIPPEVESFLINQRLEDIRKNYRQLLSAGKKEMDISTSLVNDLLKGAGDIHCLGGSEPIPRIQDEFDIALDYTKAGMGAMVLKTHYTPSSSRTALVQRYVDEWAEREGLKGVQLFGGVTLNHPVGGLNPDAVRTSAFFPNGKFIWMPTTDSYHQDYWTEACSNLAINGPKRDGIDLLTEDGKLVPQVREILEIAAKHDMVLVTSNYGEPDLTVLVDGAQQAGVKRIVIDHPASIFSKISIARMREFVRKGVWLCLSCLPSICLPTPEGRGYVTRIIKAVGPDHVVLGSDCAQVTFMTALDGMKYFIRSLLGSGISEKDMEKMLKENPAKLLDLR